MRKRRIGRREEKNRIGTEENRWERNEERRGMREGMRIGRE